MVKKLERPIAFLSAFAIFMTILLYFPVGTFSSIEWNLTANAAEGDVEINDTNFPDENFRNYVQNFDTDDADSDILSAKEIAAVTEIDVSDMGISDLKGIEYFTALENLICKRNSLTSLDTSQNTKLKKLSCYNNKLKSLNVNQNTALEYLYCYNNELTSFDLSENTALIELWCDNNHLTSLDVNKNTKLIYLDCCSNQLTSLDVSKNTALMCLVCSENSLTSLDISQNTALQALKCQNNPLIAVNAASTILADYFMASPLLPFTTKTNVIRFDDYGIKADMMSDITGGTISEDCLNITGSKVTYTYDIDGDFGENTISCTINVSGIAITEERFPDETFNDYVKQNFDTDDDYILSEEEIESVTLIDVTDMGISDLTGIEYFTALKTLNCSGNSLTSLDVSKNTTLTELYCSANPLIAVNATGSISEFYASPLSAFEADFETKSVCLADYGIKEDMVSDLTGGTISNGYLIVTDGKAKYTYDIDGGFGENTISCTINADGIVISEENFPDANFCNYVRKFDIDKNNVFSETELLKATRFEVYYKEISDLKGIEYFTALEFLSCSGNNLTSLDVSQNTELKELYCYNNKLKSLNVNQNTALEYLYCYNNELTSLDVSGCTALTNLNCENNSLTSLDLSENTALETLSCSENPLIAVNAASNISTFYVSSLSAFEAESFVICLADYGIKEDMITNITGGTISEGCLNITDSTVTYTYDIDGSLGENTISCTIKIDKVEINEKNFPDEIFRNYIQTFEDVDDEILSAKEIMKVTEIDVSDMGISDLKGIEYFTALTKLYCQKNQITSLDVSKNTALTELNCSENPLVAVNTAGSISSFDASSLSAFEIRASVICLADYGIKEDMVSDDLTGGTIENGYLFIDGTATYTYDIDGDLGTNTISCTINSNLSGIAINSENFPDENFRRYVQELDTVNDDILSSEEIVAVTKIDVSDMGISSLKGIEHFTALEILNCGSNSLKSLDVSKNTSLKTLNCSANSLTSLKVNKNTALTELCCDNNNITSLDVSQNTALENLSVSNNNLTSLDVSECTLLIYLECAKNNLTSLDLSENTALETLKCSENPLIAVNAAGSISSFDASSLSAFETKSFAIRLADYGIKEDMVSDDFTGGKILLGYLFVDGTATYTYDIDGDNGTNTISCTINAGGIAINRANFPDEKFREYVKENFDTVDDDILSGSEIAAVSRIGVYNKEISDLKGIEYFTLLYSLDCTSNNLTSLDVSQNTALALLNCESNQLESLDVSQNTALTTLNCSENSLTNLDVSQNTALTSLSCFKNNLASLDVSKNTALTSLSCFENQLTSLDVSQSTALESLRCSGNQLVSLDVSQNTALTSLDCNSNNLESLDLSENTALKYLYCSRNQLTSLDVSQNTALTSLDCNSNNLESLDLSENTALKYLYCSRNQLTSLDVSRNTELEWLECQNNQITSLDVSLNTALKTLSCYKNSLTSLDVSRNTELEWLECQNNQITSLDVSLNTALKTLNCYENEYQIKLTGSTFDVTKLTEGFDITKASEWTNAKAQDNILTVTDPTQAVTYKYDLGNGSTETFTLVPVSAELTTDMISEIEEQTYTGSEIKPEITVSCGEMTLTEGEDYTVSYEDNINAGTAKVIVTAKGEFYTGTATADFEISPLDIKNAEITLAESELIYNGKAQTQAIASVKVNGLTLTAKDYTISDNKKTNAESYTLTITGKGNFTGTATSDFKINPLDIKNAEITLAEPKLVYNGEAQKQAIESVKVNGLTLTSEDYTISDNTGTNADSYILTITGKGNFTGTATADFEIGKAEPSVTPIVEDTEFYVGDALPEIDCESVISGIINWVTELAEGLTEGKNNLEWMFTPDDTDNYKIVTGTTEVNVQTTTTEVTTTIPETTTTEATTTTIPETTTTKATTTTVPEATSTTKATTTTVPETTSTTKATTTTVPETTTTKATTTTAPETTTTKATTTTAPETTTTKATTTTAPETTTTKATTTTAPETTTTKATTTTAPETTTTKATTTTASETTTTKATTTTAPETTTTKATTT
ncbi:MAG: hypothetical protein ACI4JM_06730, partial [Oscillospiraceae bacterium]